MGEEQAHLKDKHQMFLDSESPSEALGRQGPVPELPASGRS